ncbi:MAG: hypothetical protein Q4F72_10325 [Desulfovibrionaceae bacterium]|nr:hypothetical protein [Desulfovibrionaceae bacterium]
MLRLRVIALLTIVCLALCLGCQRQPKTTAEVPRVFSPRYSIAVMPFSQPTESCDLIMGQLPENQGCIPAEQLMLLDSDLRTLLLSKKNGRDFSFETALPAFLATSTSFHTSAQPQALPHWAKLARKTGKDFILVPQVLDWRDREGSKAGVTSAAGVKLEFFLIRTETGTVSKHAIFEENQVGLTTNLLTVGDFVKRKGAWISGRELATEGMQRMLGEMGLY